LIEIAGLVLVDPGEHIGKPGLGIDVVETGGLDHRVHEGGALAAAIGACEQPGFAAERDPAQGPLRGSVLVGIDDLSRNSGPGEKPSHPFQKVGMGGQDARTMLGARWRELMACRTGGARRTSRIA
jgi:hypothetical protein